MGAFTGHYFASSRRLNPFRQISCHTSIPKMDMQQPEKENNTQITTSARCICLKPWSRWLHIFRTWKTYQRLFKVLEKKLRSLGGMQMTTRRSCNITWKQIELDLLCVFLAHTYKPLINPFSDGYNGLSHSPNALQQPHSDKAYIYNHTCMDALYMYVYVHYNIYVYIHRYAFYRFIYVLYTCFIYLSLYICCIFFCVCVGMCVWARTVCENESVVWKWLWNL